MHPDVADGLTHLAGLYKAQGAPDKAEPLLRRARDIRAKAAARRPSDARAGATATPPPR